MIQHSKLTASLATFVFIFSSFAFGQQSSVAENAAEKTFKLSFVAADKSKTVVGDLKQEEIVVSVDGKPQPISFFAVEQKPLLSVLTVDNSGSLRTQMNDLQKAAAAIVNGNKTDEEMLLVRFISSDKIYIANKFTSDKQSLLEGVGSFEAEGGASAVIDAVYLSAHKLAAHKKGDDKYRRVIFLITDGEDRASNYKEKELFDFLKKENVQVFVIALTDELENTKSLFKESTKTKSQEFIKKLAAETGGAAFFPRNLKELLETANQISSLAKTQYVIEFKSNGTQNCEKPEIDLVKGAARKKIEFYHRKDCLTAAK